MLPLIILLFTLLPALELYVLLEVGGMIGGLNTILIIIVTGVVGAALAKRQGLHVLMTMNQQMAKGQLPTDALVDGVLILIAGALLLTPGFMTDGFGFALLLPPVRMVVRAVLKKRFSKHIHVQNFHQGPMPGFGGFDQSPGFGNQQPPAQNRPEPRQTAADGETIKPKKQQVEVRPGVFMDVDG